MNGLTSLIRFIFNTLLLLLGLATAMIIIAIIFINGDDNTADPRLLIDTELNSQQRPGGSEAQTLYAALQDHVEEINTPLSTDASLASFTIETGETAQDVAEKLQILGLIHDAQLFRQLLRYNGLDTRLRAGNYQLRRNMSMKEIGAALHKGRSARLSLKVYAGWRLEELAERLTSAEIMDGQHFLRVAQQGLAINHGLLADRPPGQSYEGYLLPDTYYLLDYVTPEDLIKGMLDNLASKLPPETMELAQKQGLTFFEVLILASIVERETAIAEERPLVASVYLNRLNPLYELPHLQADPTVQYALGYQYNSGRWWKSPLQLEEYQSVDSPYNTYLYSGLPPGPIANPSLDSIMAVLHPAETDYLFSVCRQPRCQGGNHVFAQTYKEHLQNVAVYWGQ